MKAALISSSATTGSNRVATALKPQTNQQVRSRFFNMIGIESQLPSMDQARSTSPMNTQDDSAINLSWTNPRSQSVAVFTEALKYDREADKLLSAKRRKTCDQKGVDSPGKKRKTLNFSETVKVVPIPMRTEYSNRVRSRLWSNAMEIHENAARNTIEFASEGWDWQTVIEDEGMYVCVATGELVHPCHYDAGFRGKP